MNVLKWIFTNKQTLSEFLAVSVLYFFVLLFLDYLKLNLLLGLVFIIGVLFLARLFEALISLALGDHDQEIPQKYYIAMFLIVPVLSIMVRAAIL
ncbi:hypothetical protein J7I93_16095 [Bacillus sp. ISL-47]|uniref:hypothetical protein n=1 Tax=Bacillus sp. ISL-47 TaxID=2819130 RepID=UPI001BEC6E68|nr:hypothetical protein [Bacillus sp. ISL-47]MBT2689709.1 hypothetical protein [Bacillus sp. ISL-47]MBT2710000.1 hypothetical protein [Pseudomonas sp. ISL-84]